ncbi:MAG: TRAP transporter substrate-binding protein [Chloroflexota bacterium]
MSKPLVTLVTLVAAAALLMTLLTACGAAAPSPTSAPAKAAEPTKAPEPAKAAAANFPKMTVKVGSTAATGMTYFDGTAKFAELVKQRTGGNVDVQFFGNSVLGNEKDEFEQVKNGVIQMSTGSGGMLAVFQGWEPLGIFSMPYVMGGDTEAEQFKIFQKIANGPVGKELIENATKVSGIRALDITWWYGWRNLTTKSKQVTKADDLKGMKIRTPDAPIQKAGLQALGASITPLAFSELYSALQMGVVDGQENPLNTIWAQKYYEVQKYLTLTAHMTQVQVVTINEKFYQSLSPELRKVFDDAARDAGIWQSETQIKANEQALNDLKANGMVVNNIDKKEFAERTKDVYKDFESQFGKGLYEKVKAAQN